MGAEKDEIYSAKIVLAEFAPKRTDDLKPDAVRMIGRAGHFEALWVIDDEGPYHGQWAMRLPGEWRVKSAIWVPLSDLTILEPHTEGP